MPEESNHEEKRGFRFALRIISRKSRTRHEVAEALGKKGFSRTVITQSIARLEELGYLNDQDYAYNYALLRASEKLWGSSRIRAELKRRGLEEKVVDAALQKLKNEMNEEETLEKALRKKVAAMKDISGERDVRRVYSFLLRRGFPPHLIIETMKRLKIAVDHES